MLSSTLLRLLTAPREVSFRSGSFAEDDPTLAGASVQDVVDGITDLLVYLSTNVDLVRSAAEERESVR